MKKLTMLLLLFTITLFSQTINAQNDKTLDKTTFVKAAKILEQEPFIKDAKKYREALTLYLIETKDVSIVVCTSSATEMIFDKKYKFSNELFGQNMFGMAIFKLENPDKKDDEKAAQFAGVESMLRAYEAMVKQNSKAKFAEADALITKRIDGTLAKFVADNDCSSK